jgi:hypothetical protein
MQGMSTSEGHP